MSSDTSPSTSTTPIIGEANTNDLIFANALAAAYRNRTWLYNPDLALRRDVNVWEKINRYPKIKHALQKRAHSVATREWNVEPGDEEEPSELAAEIVKGMLKKIPRFSMARFRLSRALILGNANEWMDCARKPQSFAKTAPMPWLTVTGLRQIDYRRIRLWPRWSKPVAGGDAHIEEIELHLGEIATFGQYVKIENPELLMRGVYDDEEARLGYGCGLIEAIYWGFWIIELLMREGLEGVERWAQGWVVGSVDQSVFGATDRTADDVATALFEALQMMRSRGVLLVGKGETIDVKETTGTGHQLVMSLIESVKDDLVQLISGAIRPSGGGEGGTYGQGKVEERTVDEIVRFDRDFLDETITRDLIGLIWRYNRPQFEALCPGAVMPRYVSVETDHETPKEFIERAKLFHDLGLDLVKTELYTRAGFARPTEEMEDDEILEGAAAPVPGMGGGDPFGDLAGLDKPPKSDAARE